MERRKSFFDDHISVVESSHNKTAAKKNNSNDSLLDKIAKELGYNEKVAQAPVAEGEVSPAESSVAGANPTVTEATDAVTVPQTTIAGGNPNEAMAGEMPAQTKTNEGLAISAGDGKVTDANNLHKTPESVAAAAMDAGGDEAAAATPNPEKASQMPDNDLDGTKTAEAEKIGQLIAKSFQESLEKSASDAEYAEAIGILKEAGLLDNYKLNDEPMSKEASYQEGGLEKIANNESLTRKDIVGAAIEVLEFQKEAAYAEEQGRSDAQEAVAKMMEEQEKEASDKQEQEKMASLMEDKDVVSAVKILKEKGIL